MVDHLPRDPAGQGTRAGQVLNTRNRHCLPRQVTLRTAILGTLLVTGARLAHAQGAAPGDSTVRSFGGGVYLFHYRPFDLPGAVANTEVYAAYATADVRHGRWHLFGEGRARDSKLRPWFNGPTWVQQAWVAYDAAPSAADSRLTMRAGKIYQTLGRFWDGSFFGNVHYFDGLKLNPQFGADASGLWRVKGALALGYTAQYVANSDRVSGALAGRDFETLSGFRDRDGFAARGTLSIPVGATTVTLGLSGLSRGAGDSTGRTWRVPHVAADGEWRAGPTILYAEWTRRAAGDVPVPLRATIPGSRAEYWLAGAQWHQSILHLRYNFSRAVYDDIGRSDWIHQPGVTIDLARDVHAFLELDEWRTHNDRLSGVRTVTTDQSLNFVLQLVVP